MKNILNTKPSIKLEGRERFSVSFVDDSDINKKKILDIGCGYGWCELAMRKKGAREQFGLELTEKDLATAKKNIKDKNIHYLEGSAIRIPFEKSAFDTVLAWEVIEHIPKDTEEKMFSEVHRVLKKGGSFYLSTPNNTFFSTLLDPAWWLIGHRHYRVEKLIKFASYHGLLVENLEIRGGWWTIFSLLHLYISKWIFRRSLPFSKELRRLDTKGYSTEGFTTLFIKFRKI